MGHTSEFRRMSHSLSSNTFGSSAAVLNLSHSWGKSLQDGQAAPVQQPHHFTGLQSASSFPLQHKSSTVLQSRRHQSELQQHGRHCTSSDSHAFCWGAQAVRTGQTLGLVKWLLPWEECFFKEKNPFLVLLAFQNQNNQQIKSTPVVVVLI